MPHTIKPLPPLSDADIAYFWSRVSKSPGYGPYGDCWPWIYITTSVNAASYGSVWIGRKRYSFHRLGYLIQKGEDPFPLLVCHVCDWPPCVRGEHLFKGTYRDNNHDMANKGRQYSGPKPWNASLDDAAVSEIRVRYSAGGVTQQQLADEFGVNQSQINRIVKRYRRRHVI